MSLRCSPLVLIAAALAWGTPAFAQEGRVVADCQGPKPAPGARFSGPVLQVLDAQRLCVALGPDPKDWIEVAPVGVLPVSNAPNEGRTLLMASTFSKRVDCVAADPHENAVGAVCTVDGSALAEAMRAAKATPEWKAWR